MARERAIVPAEVPARPWWRHALLTYLVIGGLSFVVDLGLLLLLSGPGGLPVWLAATVGYWTSVLVNFGLNRRSMGGGSGRLRVQSMRYASPTRWEISCTNRDRDVGASALCCRRQ